MEREFLLLRCWDQLTDAEAELVARTLARCLPRPWRFEKVRRYQMGYQKRPVAFFRWNEDRFALIPGGHVTLGYDRSRPWVPPPALRAEWDGYTRGLGYGAVEDFLERFTPLRQLELQPFLLETEAPDYEERLPTVQGGERSHLRSWTHRSIRAALARDGFRLPTSDEWEHACAAGSRTLWRWGDDCPEGFLLYHCAQPYLVHMRPNAFGLRIAYDPYRWEPCAEITVRRGGDGGGVICGGDGFLVAWLTAASAFQVAYEESAAAQLEVETFWAPHVRRAFSVPPEFLD